MYYPLPKSLSAKVNENPIFLWMDKDVDRAL